MAYCAKTARLLLSRPGIISGNLQKSILITSSLTSQNELAVVRFTGRTFSFTALQQSKNLSKSGNQINADKLSHSEEITLTDSCIKRLKFISQDDPNSYLRIMVEGGGCSGFQYKFELCTDPIQDSDDVIVQRDGAKVVVDQTSLDYLKGATLDYQVELIRSAFRILENPKAEQGCSCGVSFSLKL